MGGLVVVLLLGVSFYGGVIYARNQNPDNRSLSSADHQFALGMVVYISPKAITIAYVKSPATQTFRINNKTIVSIDGRPGTSSQIKPGAMVLIRITKNKRNAGVILVNSTFSG